MITDQVKSICHQMRLFGVRDAVERRAQAALADQQHPLEFLRLVLEDELLARRNSLGKRLTTKACFRATADLEDLDVTYDRGITKAKLKEISLLNFYHNRENLLMLGVLEPAKPTWQSPSVAERAKKPYRQHLYRQVFYLKKRSRNVQQERM